MEKVVGILGGMGPQATLDLMAKILAATPAQSEQDHLRMVVDCNPKVPSRVAAICNTAHHFRPAIQAAVSVPVLDMIALTAQRVADLHRPVHTVGLLATNGTIELGLYHQQYTP